VDDPVRGWDAFYDNTLRRIRQCWRTPDPWSQEPHSSIAGIAPVYRRAMQLVPPGTVLDLGSCFGFLALLLAERGDGAVIASDIAPGTMRLLARMARLRGLPVDTQVCDAARVPLPDAAVDTVTVIHVLEHLEPEQGAAVLREALRLARRRVVVAVPFEEEPTAAYGHLRTFGPADLAGLGRRSGRRFTVEEHHGGWLVLDA
jgi:SAM-dependent methyltransferase